MFFDCEACGILAPQTGIEPTPPALTGEVLMPLDHQGSPHLLNDGLCIFHRTRTNNFIVCMETYTLYYLVLSYISSPTAFLTL